MFTSILGTVAEMKQKSTRERSLRKKSLGVWRWESEPMARMMSKFPAAPTRYMTRKSPKISSCLSSWLESPRRMNSEALVCGFTSPWLAGPARRSRPGADFREDGGAHASLLPSYNPSAHISVFIW